MVLTDIAENIEAAIPNYSNVARPKTRKVSTFHSFDSFYPKTISEEIEAITISFRGFLEKDLLEQEQKLYYLLQSVNDILWVFFDRDIATYVAISSVSPVEATGVPQVDNYTLGMIARGKSLGQVRTATDIRCMYDSEEVADDNGFQGKVIELVNTEDIFFNGVYQSAFSLPLGDYQMFMRAKCHNSSVSSDVGIGRCFFYDYDAGTFTDLTDAINNPTENDVTLPPSDLEGENDAIYFGSDIPNNKLKIIIGSAAVLNFTLEYEYWNGSEWASVENISDGTEAFTKTGTKHITFDMPGDWVQTAVNGVTMFWFRLRAVSGGGIFPLAYYASIFDCGPIDRCFFYDYDAGTFTDLTDEIYDSTINNVILPPSDLEGENDAIYFGTDSKYNDYILFVTTPTILNYTLEYEYWNGSEWASVENISDGTEAFTKTGTKHITFDMPGDWVQTAVNGVTMFWFRLRAHNIMTDIFPLATQGWFVLGVARMEVKNYDDDTIIASESKQLDQSVYKTYLLDFTIGEEDKNDQIQFTVKKEATAGNDYVRVDFLGFVAKE